MNPFELYESRKLLPRPSPGKPSLAPEQRIGEWRLMNYVAGDHNHAASWRCECSCGHQKLVSVENLRKGRSNSCGHGRSERFTERLKMMAKGPVPPIKPPPRGQA
jgi:hypothetical protein